MKINLGACDRHIEGYTCFDIAPKCPICRTPRVDLSRTWPWQSGSCEAILAYDVVEHIGNGWRYKFNYEKVEVAGRQFTLLTEPPEEYYFWGRIHFASEAWRVLRPGGKLHITTPNAARGGGYQQDLTHNNPWTVNTFKYLGTKEDGSITPEWKRFADSWQAAWGMILGKFRPIHIKQSMYQDQSLGPNCALPDPVYKLDVLLEAVK